MKTLTFLTVLLFVFIQINAQENYSSVYGRITNYEATMKTYPPDESAEAVVIYENGTSYFRPNYYSGNFDLCMEKSIKIKILKQSGIKYGEFEIPYYTGSKIEEISGLEGITYNYDNNAFTKSALDSKNVYDEKINDKWRSKKFAMPDVREGSIVEVKYLIISPYIFNMREWKFQKEIPVVASHFTLRATPYYGYTYIVNGITKFDEYSAEPLNDEILFGNLKYREMKYQFGMKNLPAFRDEEFITSEKDYIIGMNFELSKINYPRGGSRTIMSTWPEISDAYLKGDNFGKYINSAEKEAKKILPDLNLSGKTQVEQLKIIAEYVKKNYNWNGITTGYASAKIFDFLKQKTGGSGDINLFLIGMLKAAGMDVFPLLLSTRDNGAINTKYPFSSFFNYVIAGVNINNQTVFVDATELMLPYNKLPERCVNVNALTVKPKSDKWIGITQPDIALTEKTLDISINENAGFLTANVTVAASASDGYMFRKFFSGKPDNLVKYLVSRKIVPQNLRIYNYRDLEKPFTFSYTSNKEIEKSFDKLFIAPFQDLAPSENIFKQTTRTLPVDLINFQAGSYNSTIRIPDGYKISQIPQAYENDGPYIKISYKVDLSDDRIEISGDYLFKKIIYEAREYQALKVTFDKVISLLNEMIVLEKK